MTVALNKLPLEYDHVIVCGPVFPHEVVGFSGGTKYLFPGIAGPEIIHFTHWLGALITNYDVIGTKATPVRAVIDRAARLLDRPLSLLAPVVMHEGTAGLFCGPVHEAWSAAADLSSRRHVVWLDQPVKRVLSIMPAMYDDLWVAAKGMYKMEPAVADGGEVVIYAPHVTEVSHVHGKLIDQVGYHCKDYFVKQWDRFQDVPGGILAHSTHVKGLGSYDPATGVETPAHPRHPRHRHPARALRAHRPRLPGPGERRRRGLEEGPRHPRRPPRGGDALSMHDPREARVDLSHARLSSLRPLPRS